MSDDRLYDAKEWVDETGAATGDARENDPSSAGFTNRDDRFYRSHFQHVNRLADRADSPPSDEIEKDLENGWLNVRVGKGDWAAAPDVADQIKSDRGRQGRVTGMPPAGTTPTHDRVSFSDPIAGNVDPTSP
ncbi:MAG: hypothetical protein ACM37U_05880 [Gemmatimonas sp.]|nr:hypothetical protein [Gemmatimonadaceae bacterium]